MLINVLIIEYTFVIVLWLSLSLSLSVFNRYDWFAAVLMNY
jgi:hypothetical protein